MGQKDEKLEVKLVPGPEEIEFLCGLTRHDQRLIDHIHDTVDTLHAMCEVRVGMAEQVKPAKTFGVKEACELRDLIIERANRLLRELIEKVRRECP